jgi:hypothetical protein
MGIGGMVNIIQRRQASGKRLPASGKGRPASGIRHRASGKGRPASGVRRAASGKRRSDRNK